MSGSWDFIDDCLTQDGKTVVIPLTEELEPQPHGGALVRRHAATTEYIDPHRQPVELWPPRLVLDVCLCETPGEQYEAAGKYGLSPTEFDKVAAIPAFRRAVHEMAITLREEGYTFKQKCRAIAEDFLPQIDNALHDRLIGFGAKMDAFKQLARLGELEPAPKKPDGNQNNNAQTVNIQINI